MLNNTLPDIGLTLRVPKKGDQGFMRFYAKAGDAQRHMRKMGTAIKKGGMPSEADINKLIDGMILFVPKDEQVGARDIILDWSADQLVAATNLIVLAMAGNIESDVADGTMDDTPAAQATVNQLNGMSDAMRAALAQE